MSGLLPYSPTTAKPRRNFSDRGRQRERREKKPGGQTTRWFPFVECGGEKKSGFVGNRLLCFQGGEGEKLTVWYAWICLDLVLDVLVRKVFPSMLEDVFGE